MADNDKNSKVFIERELNDEVVGEYDEEGFFNTPNGSFWDPDGVYFNREVMTSMGGIMMIRPKNMYLEKDGMKLIIVIKMKLMKLMMIIMMNMEVIMMI